MTESTSLNQHELWFARNITQIALANGAQAFSMMIKERVKLDKFFINPNVLFETSENELTSTGKVHVMTTDFIVNLLAKSYLILSAYDAEKVAERCLPPAYQKHQMMKEGTLLEMDNIIAASVATKYSDILYTDVKGDVPSITYLDPEKVNARLEEVIQRKTSNFYYSVYFISEESHIQAEFICIFANTFVESIKELNDNKHVETIIKSYADYTRRQFDM